MSQSDNCKKDKCTTCSDYTDCVTRELKSNAYIVAYTLLASGIGAVLLWLFIR